MKENGVTDETIHVACQKLLEDVLEVEHIGVSAENKVKQALNWHNGALSNPLSLAQWLTVLRVVGSDLSLRLETSEKYIYLQFEPERNKTVVNDPAADTSTPIERSDVSDLFEDAEKKLHPSWYTPKKTYKAVTAVVTGSDDPQIVYGEYHSPFRTRMGDGGLEDSGSQKQESTEWFYPKTTFELPREMTGSEIQEWLNRNEGIAATIHHVVKTNESRGWGSTTMQTRKTD